MIAQSDPLGSVVIHASWQALWAPDLEDKALRDSILSSEQFSHRIADQLIGTPTFIASPIPNQDELLRQIDVHGTAESMRYTGLMWLAPRLILCLASKQTRDVCGELSYKEIRDLAHFRTHVPLDCIKRLPEDSGIEREGWKCLAAWTSGLGGSIAARLQLQLPPEAFDMIDEFDARSALMTKVMRYRAQEFGEG